MTDSPPVPDRKDAVTPGPFYLFLKAPQKRRRPPRRADAVVHLEGASTPGVCLHHNFHQFRQLADEVKEPVQSFLLFALGVWTADKLSPRARQPDAWTRQFVLDTPCPRGWAEVAPELVRLVNFLTGDNWTIQPRETRIDLKFAGTWPRGWRPTAVTLFSGGLDSLTGAIDLLEEGQRLVLVSHYDYGQLAAAQQSLAAALAEHYGPDRIHHLAVRVQLEGPELTLRSRSLLYLALGLNAAAAFPGGLPLFIPENGWISLNPPLTLNRLGAYSTRTTHPHFLEGLTAIWRRLGLGQEVKNPYQELTKGQILTRCRNLGLLEKLAPLSISCARPVAGRWQGQPMGACGYCYPCLMRRAALHCLGWDRGKNYRVDVLADPAALRHRVQGRNLRALCLAVRTWEENPQEVISRLWLGTRPQVIAARAPAAKTLLGGGFRELAHWLRDQGGVRIRDFMGEKIS